MTSDWQCILGPLDWGTFEAPTRPRKRPRIKKITSIDYRTFFVGENRNNWFVRYRGPEATPDLRRSAHQRISKTFRPLWEHQKNRFVQEEGLKRILEMVAFYWLEMKASKRLLRFSPYSTVVVSRGWHIRSEDRALKTPKLPFDPILHLAPAFVDEGQINPKYTKVGGRNCLCDWWWLERCSELNLRF